MSTPALEKLLKDFYLISGMEISLTDNKLHGIAFRCPRENFCSLIHKSHTCLEMCKVSDMEHFDEAARCGKDVYYTCPFGIREVIIPLLRDGRISAYIFAAMGIEQQDGIDDKIIGKALEIMPSLNAELLRSGIGEIPHFTAREMEGYLSMLRLIAEHIESHDLLTDSKTSIGELVKNYIRNNLARKITLTDLSWNLHCSTVTLTEHFKREFGITITEYVTKKRMSLAAQLLTTLDEPLGSVAQRCGFSDVEYFSRTFKRHFGLPPGRWRSEQLAKD